MFYCNNSYNLPIKNYTFYNFYEIILFKINKPYTSIIISENLYFIVNFLNYS